VEERVPDVRSFAELTLVARDLDALTRFYTEVFALEHLGADPDRVWLAVGGSARLGIWTPGRKEHDDEGGRHVHFAFTVASGSIDAIARRARAAGAEVEGPVIHDGGDRSLYVTDPEGNRVEAWDYFARSPAADPPGA
jgi:catechol-2,3-dioxygenase